MSKKVYVLPQKKKKKNLRARILLVDSLFLIQQLVSMVPKLIVL